MGTREGEQSSFGRRGSKDQILMKKTYYGELGVARLQDSQQTRNTAYATLETFSPGSPLEDSSSQVEASDQNTRGHQQAI